MRSSWTRRFAFAALSAAAVFASHRDAFACGGSFTPAAPSGESEDVVTDHRMVFSVGIDQTTLYDEIQFTGNAESFAWVLPVRGTASIGVSSDAVFQTIDSLTQVNVLAPPMNCPPPPVCNNADTPGAAAAGDAGAAGAPGVTVTQQQVVGPYETVQLSSTDPNALNAWLTQHGYSVPADVQPIIASYVQEQFNFVAVKLVPGQGVQSMRPIRVTWNGAAVALPLRMVTAGTASSAGVSLWVVGDGRWEAQTFPNFTIQANELVWDWNTSTSNYDALRAQKQNALGGAAWQSESSVSIDSASTQATIWQRAQGWGNGGGGGTSDYGTPDGGAADPDGGAATPQDPMSAFNDDMGYLFGNKPAVRVTRMRADVPKASLVSDLVLQASADQSELPRTLQVTRELNQPSCPVYNDQCQQTGTAPRDQAQAAADASGHGFGGCSTATTRSRQTGTFFLIGVSVAALAIMRSRRRTAQRR
jgi:hypothetical protein